MRLRFWGTRGSIAKAGTSTVRYGGNTSCVSVRSESGTLLVLDCGTGATGLAQDLLSSSGGEPQEGYLLITHTHWDHIQGFPFFSPLFVPGNRWHVHGPRGVGSSLRDALAGQMQYTYFPITLEHLTASVDYHDLLEGTFEVGDIKVTARYLNHPALTLGYRLEVDGVTVVYATDHEPHSRRLAFGRRGPLGVQDEKHARFLSGADLVIHDAQYTADEYSNRLGWGHSTVESVVDTALAADVKRLALFHHDPLRDDGAIDNLVEMARGRVVSGHDMEVFAAAEGHTVALTSSTASPPEQSVPIEISATASISDAVRTQSVLVAVSDVGLAEILEQATLAENLALLTANNSEQVMKLVGEYKPSLVIMGPDLPGHESARVPGRAADADSGADEGDALRADLILALCHKLRSHSEPDVREMAIVLIESQEDAARQQAAAKLNITDWLLLPFSEAYARSRIRTWVLRIAYRWQAAPLPRNEAQRLRSLQQCGLLDTEPEERFDRYTRIAAALFDVPVALVSLVDKDRQWFKSHHGTDATETPRNIAFCAHTILGSDILQVPDAHRDSRFADNPLVHGEHRLRFYAGMPLFIDGDIPVGTLCLIDHRARELDESQLDLLRDLGHLVERELALGGTD